MRGAALPLAVSARVIMPMASATRWGVSNWLTSFSATWEVTRAVHKFFSTLSSPQMPR